jgi:hypothetical protein
MFEHHKQPLLPRRAFALRLLRHTWLALALVAGALSIGVIGYRFIARLSRVDAIENAAMILGGMGRVSELPANSAKLFAAGYALFSVIAFLLSFGLVLAPVVHRLLHRFHIETDDR